MGRRGGGGFGGGGGSRNPSGGGLFGRSAPAPAKKQQAPARAPPPPAAAPAAAAPAPAAGGGGMLSGLAGTMMSGMAFGTGSAVAHRAVDSVMGPRTTQVEHVNSDQQPQTGSTDMASSGMASNSNVSCGDESTQFNQCLQQNPGDFSSCRFFFDVLNQCQNDSSMK